MSISLNLAFLPASLNTRDLYLTWRFLAATCLYYTEGLPFLVVLCEHLSTVNPIRTDPVALVVGFLIDINPQSLFITMPGETSQTLCEPSLRLPSTLFSIFFVCHSRFWLEKLC